MSGFKYLLNFRKYDSVLNMLRHAIMEEFWIFQDSEYAKFLHMQALRKVLNMPEYGWIMPDYSVLNMPDQHFTGL